MNCHGWMEMRTQWSPPLIGGSTRACWRACIRFAWPQWSPPLIGGSTDQLEIWAVPSGKAAMEPAVDRLEHPGPRRERRGFHAAAMEPAVDRREHDVPGGPAGTGVRAAMEPAVDRREHPRGVTAAQVSEKRAAMEPAVDRREHGGAFLNRTVGVLVEHPRRDELRHLDDRHV